MTQLWERPRPKPYVLPPGQRVMPVHMPTIRAQQPSQPLYAPPVAQPVRVRRFRRRRFC